MDKCIFCKIINKKVPAKIVYEDNKVICFLPKKMEVYGHTLIVPKKHYADIYDIPEEKFSYIIKTAKKLAVNPDVQT
ncbi:MAG: hypothetical protein A2Y98_01235 [Candidatus Portnoybacteria bacterium RBG_19FT_COMBO_36_7]|uniref:HIT domain-containing protein n=1 Tax=Candidatus Portnoybacteria bacterium RBG_19FT_COMBO_36_7 TaxID=1801992 RepID=A0A1G2F7D7_9BACT|nr:MAG: hypothetical protein A2Y98_01235 [Candidatus Portnoybacteria bacterium RBG_19FT_COMBO_36_7]